MNKLIGIALLLYLLGDPGLSLLAGAGAARDYIVTAMVMLVSAPWMRAQFDG